MWALCVTLTFLIALQGTLTHPVKDGEVKTPRACGYESCPVGKPGRLNVHLIAHTHDDVGWLKTVDQYYYGGRNKIQNAGVQYIIDSVVEELLKDPTKRFIYVEAAFFSKWWLEQDATRRAEVRSLVDSGQLEIIGGAWSMNDEAVTNYQSIIDQFTWGFRMFNDTLGECAAPRVGWQIDPFGHSREMASLLAQLGMDGLFFGRLDYQDKEVRLRDKTMEMIWNGSPDNLGPSSDLFTHAMYNTYFSPPGFCFDIFCNDEPLVDNPRSVMYNIDERVEKFIKFVREQAEGYKTNNLLVTVGGDFHYQSAPAWFKNLDKLIKHTNKLQATGGDVNLFYSTPSCYLKAASESDAVWPTKQDDFFPYGSDENSYWTGYFTSKPTIKYFERLGNNFLQVSKQLTALAGMSLSETPGVTGLREAMGIMQHHDAITGTMKDHVAQDYSRILTEAIEQSSNDVSKAINYLIHGENLESIPFVPCLKLNNSESVSGDVNKFIVTVHNPLGRKVSQYVRLPVMQTNYVIKDPKGVEVPYQIVPLPSWVTSLPGRESEATNEIVFKAVDLPPVGFRTYYFSPTTKQNKRTAVHPPVPHLRADTISNQFISLNVDDAGQIESIHMNDLQMSLRQTFGYYKGYFEDGKRASGAYIFRPNGTESVNLELNTTTIIKGDLVQEIHQSYDDGWVAQVIRLYNDENHLEFEWQVGPIPSADGVGKEVISRFQTNLDSYTEFYTDSNGREMLKRVRNFRPTWTLNLTEPVASNFYPVTSKIVIKDEAQGQEAAFFVDRAQAGSSMASGQVELMLHRRLFHDDDKGVDEPLNEIQYGVGLVARGKHYLMAGPNRELNPSLAAQERLLAQNKLMQPWIFVSPAVDMPYLVWASSFAIELSGLRQSLPDNIHLLTLEPWGDKSWLVRLEHIMEKGEDVELSTPATVDLQNLFEKFTITSARETTLGANKVLKEASKLTWRSARETNPPTKDLNKYVDLVAITLEPMQIRTFIVDIKPRPPAHIVKV